MKRLYKKYIIFFAALLVFTGLFSTHLQANVNQYGTVKLIGSVNPISAEHIVASIKESNKKGHQFVVLQMNTPGGLVTSMREIVTAILTSEIPVVVYTYPKGAQAASAGGFIMLSAHVAAMSPGTEIGAMHPVSPALNFGKKDKEGKPEEGVMEKKVLNDILAYARGLAQKRNRSVRWAERAVKDAISNTYLEAKRLGIIDIIANDMGDLLKKLDGRTVRMDGKTVRLQTLNLTEYAFEMSWKEKFFNFFADPQVVYLLFIIAAIGIWTEIKNPGLIIPGVVGVLAFLIFLMAIRVLPINFAGLFLIVLAIILLILELNVVSYGLLTIGGIISFIIGSMILFDSPLPGFQIPIATIIAVVLFVLGFVFIAVRAVLAVHKNKVTTGQRGLIGEQGFARNDFNIKGTVFVHGEIWTAKSDEDIKKDDTIVVEDVMGMVLKVKKVVE